MMRVSPSPPYLLCAAPAQRRSAHHPKCRWAVARIPRHPPFVSRPRMRGWAWSKSSKVIWSGGTEAYHSDVPVSRRSIRTPPLRCVTRITRSALSYSCRRIERRRFSFARPAFVTNPTTSRSLIVWRAARMDRWNSWWASRSSTSSSRYIVGRQARTTRPACVSSIFLSSMSNINVVIWWQVKARATCTRGKISSRVSPARFPRATMPCGSTEFPPSRKTTSWPSMTARTQRRVVRWNTKSEPLSIRVTLPASKDPRIRSRVGTEVVRAGREIARSSGTGTMAGSTTSAMESSPRFDGDGGIKSEAQGRGERKYRVPGRTPRRGVTLKNARDVGPPRDAMADLGFFVVLFGGAVVLLVVLATWALRKPLLAVVPAPPDAARRDLAYRIRAIGYPVEVVKDVLRVKVDSIAQLKLRIRGGPRGTEIRYEVDATRVGWRSRFSCPTPSCRARFWPFSCPGSRSSWVLGLCICAVLRGSGSFSKMRISIARRGWGRPSPVRAGGNLGRASRCFSGPRPDPRCGERSVPPDGSGTIRSPV